MKKSQENPGNWYSGNLKQSKNGYVLDAEIGSIEIQDEQRLEEAWLDLRKNPRELLIYGTVRTEKSLTGRETYSMDPERIGYLLEDDFDGRDVLVSGYDLIFLDGEDEVVYTGQDFEDLRDNVVGWFDDEDEKLESLTDLKLEMDYWPWGR